MERSFLAYLRGRCQSLRQVPVGIGDDAAVLDPPIGRQVLCTDQIIDGVDFRSDEQSLADVGYKSMAINLSDIAAMGAVPVAALVTLSLPKTNATRIAGEVYEGILQAAGQFDVAIAGGDLSTYEGPLALSVTMTGDVHGGEPWLRSGAKEGGAVLVSGAVGGSLLGRHLRPTPRIELAGRLRRLATVNAAIDVSDGLSLDLDRLLAASRVGAELDVDQIPIHEDAVARSRQTGLTPFQHAWSDGEDFELIVTMSPDDADRVLRCKELSVPMTRIGTVTGRTGLWKKSTGKVERLSPQGY